MNEKKTVRTIHAQNIFNKRILNEEILSIENCPKEHLICPYKKKNKTCCSSS